jgi:hypothetical protein
VYSLIGDRAGKNAGKAREAIKIIAKHLINLIFSLDILNIQTIRAELTLINNIYNTSLRKTVRFTYFLKKAYIDNTFRPHSSLNNLTPEQFLDQHIRSPKSLRLACPGYGGRLKIISFFILNMYN